METYDPIAIVDVGALHVWAMPYGWGGVSRAPARVKKQALAFVPPLLRYIYLHMITHHIYILIYILYIWSHIIYICNKKKKYMHCGKPNGQPPFEYFGMVYTTLFLAKLGMVCNVLCHSSLIGNPLCFSQWAFSFSRTCSGACRRKICSWASVCPQTALKLSWWIAPAPKEARVPRLLDVNMFDDHVSYVSSFLHPFFPWQTECLWALHHLNPKRI